MSAVLKRLGYGLVPVIVLLALGEGLARLLGLGGMVLYPTPGNCQRRSPSLGEEFRPNCTAQVAGKAFHTNGLGLRDDELAEDGRRRILALGDSCTFGWGVEQDEAYPQVLQRVLDAQVGPGAYRVINAGVPGYTSYHGQVFLEQYGRTLRPDVVVVAFGFNDIAPGGDVETALAARRRMLPLLRLDDALLDHSRLWRWLRALTAHGPPPIAPPRSSPERYGEHLRAIVRLARALGARPVLVDFLHEESPQVEHLAALHAAARDLGVPLVTYAGPRLDVVHPTRDGYAAFARRLARVLDDTGLVDGASDKGRAAEQPSVSD